MTNIWLIFFKNKIKEISKFVGIVYCICYGIGWSIFNMFPSYVEFLSFPHENISIHKYMIKIGFFHIFHLFIFSLFCYFIIYIGSIYIIKWIKDNWQLAKEESIKNINLKNCKKTLIKSSCLNIQNK